MPDSPSATTIIAFDYGLRRIGVAAGQSVTGSAGPLATISNGSSGPDFEHIGALIAEWRPDVLVVGLPRRADGGTGDMEAPVKSFAKSLSQFGIPIEFVDERYTSIEASETLRLARQSGTRGRIRKEHIDAAAAVLIAERYLSGGRHEA